MARTALGLTVEEWQAYRPGEVDAGEARRQAARILHDQFGASKVMVFGSLAQSMRFTRWSDVDLAA